MFDHLFFTPVYPAFGMQHLHILLTETTNKKSLAGWNLFITGWWLNQPTWNICSSTWESSPRFGVKIKNIWNHHLAKQLAIVLFEVAVILSSQRRFPIRRDEPPSKKKV